MGLDLYFYRCKKSCYEQYKDDRDALCKETGLADWRWMSRACVMRQASLSGAPVKAEDEDDFPNECDSVILVDNWSQHAGAVYRWLIERTELTMQDRHPVMVSQECITELYKACQTVVSLEPDEDGYIDCNICEQTLPAMESSYFGMTEYCEEYQEEVQQALDTLNILFDTIDFDAEVVLVQASW